MTEVRMATAADKSAILTLCRMLHEENGQHTYDVERVERMIDRCLHQAGGIIGVVGNDMVAGVIVLLIDPVWYSNDFQLLELLNYVHPEHRRSDFAKSMIQYARDCADRTGLNLTVGAVVNPQTEAKCRLYARLLPAAGSFFRYRPATTSEAA